jgi:hypothetical protein
MNVAGDRHRTPWPDGCRHRPGTGSAQVSARKAHAGYDWGMIAITVDVTDPGAAGDQALLSATGEMPFHGCYTPAPVPLATLVAVAGRRSTIEEAFQAGKRLTGQDEHQVRRSKSWHGLDHPRDACPHLPRRHYRDRTRRDPEGTKGSSRRPRTRSCTCSQPARPRAP